MNERFIRCGAQVLTLPILEVVKKNKSKENIYLPDVFRTEYREILKTITGKRNWVVASAALLMFIEANEQTRIDVMRRMEDADRIGGSFEKLLEEALEKSRGPRRKGGVVHASPRPQPPAPAETAGGGKSGGRG